MSACFADAAWSGAMVETGHIAHLVLKSGDDVSIRVAGGTAGTFSGQAKR